MWRPFCPTWPTTNSRWWTTGSGPRMPRRTRAKFSRNRGACSTQSKLFKATGHKINPQQEDQLSSTNIWILCYSNPKSTGGVGNFFVIRPSSQGLARICLQFCRFFQQPLWHFRSQIVADLSSYFWHIYTFSLISKGFNTGQANSYINVLTPRLQVIGREQRELSQKKNEETEREIEARERKAFIYKLR